MKSLIFSLLFATGCIAVSADEPRACDSKSLAFSVPFHPNAQIPPVMQNFTIDLSETKDFLTEVLLIDGEITRVDGGDLSFLDEVMISIANPSGNTNNDLVLWDSQHNSGTTLSVKASDINLVDYIDSNNNFTVNVTTSTQNPPADYWQLNTALCVSAKANKTYSF